MDIYIHVHACKHLGMQNLTQILVVINHRSFFFFFNRQNKIQWTHKPGTKIWTLLAETHLWVTASLSKHSTGTLSLWALHTAQHKTRPFFSLKKTHTKQTETHHYSHVENLGRLTYVRLRQLKRAALPIPTSIFVCPCNGMAASIWYF